MRVAVISDIHGNLTALRAVERDLAAVAPDLVVVGGDLVGNGGRIADVIDLIRDRAWPSIAGNTDEMVWEPERIDALAARIPSMAAMWRILGDDIARARRDMGDARLAWLRALPGEWKDDRLAIVHASPGDKWIAPAVGAPDKELARTYGPLERPLVVYGHLHVPFTRILSGLTVLNSGSVGMPHDGDPRASYLVIDDGVPDVRRVAYDIDAEIADRRAAGYPNVDWLSRILYGAAFIPPE